MDKEYLIKIIKEVISEKTSQEKVKDILKKGVIGVPGQVFARAAALEKLASSQLDREQELEILEKELKYKKLKPKKFGPEWTVERLKDEYTTAKQGMERLRTKHGDTDVFWTDKERKERDEYLRTLKGVLSDPRMKDVDMSELMLTKESIQRTIKIKILKSR